MDVVTKAINHFLQLVGKPNQLSLVLRRFRGQFGRGGGCEEYYFDVVVPHKVEVYHSGLELARMAENYWQFKNIRLIDHDISKLSKEEAVYAEMDFIDFDNNSTSQMIRFRKAWHHHKHHNSHHPEYWFNVNKSGDVDILPMPKDDVLEMVANWMGGGSSMEEFLNENLSNFVFHRDTAIQLQKLLDKFGITTSSVNSKQFFNAKILK